MYVRTLKSVAVVLFGLASSAWGQCPLELAHWGYGPTATVAVSGTTVVAGSGSVLQIIDGSDPASPTVVGELTMEGGIRDVVVVGETAFLAVHGEGLATVDISDPAHPDLLSVLDAGGPNASLWILKKGGDTLYVGGLAGLEIFDISDLQDPSLIGSLSEGISAVLGLAVTGSIAVVADSAEVVSTVDVSDPRHPHILGSFQGDQRVYGLAAAGSAAYVGLSSHGIHVVDLSDPAAPVLAATVDGRANGMEIAGGRLYVAGGSSGLLIYDLTNPLAPTAVGSAFAAGNIFEVAVGVPTAWGALDAGGVAAFDISEPASPAILGTLPGTSWATGVALRGSLAAVPTSSSRILLFDVADPSTPTLAGQIEGFFRAAALAGDILVGVGSSFQTFDVADPSTPRALGSFSPSSSLRSVAEQDDLAVAVARYGPISMVDISDPADPQELASLEIEGNFVDAPSFNRTAMYLPDYSSGIRVVDISDPAHPVEAEVLSLNRPTSPVVTRGSYGFVATAAGIELLDLSQPLHPIVVTSSAAAPDVYGEAAWSNGLAIAGSRLAAVSNHDLLLIDITDPLVPVRIGAQTLPSPWYLGESTADAQGNTLAMSRADQGARFFDLSDCAAGPPEASFVWSPNEPVAGQTVGFTDTSTGSVTSRSWDFGDGSHSSDARPFHAFSEEGSYDVTLTVSGSEGSDTATRTVVVCCATSPPITGPWDHALLIPAAAHVAGLHGTRWVTDLVLENLDVTAATAYLYLMRAGQDNSAAEAVTMTVDPESSAGVSDAIATLFETTDATGAILVGSSGELVASSRTYNDAEAGTYGQLIPGIPLETVFGAGESARLIQLTRNGSFRTNIGFASASATPITLDVTLHSADGTALGTVSETLPAYGYLQVTDIFGADVEDGYAEVSCDTAGARWATYASVVDNQTGDPIFVLPSEGGQQLCVPAVAHVAGYGGTLWRSDVEIYNPGVSVNEVTLRLLESDQDNSSGLSHTVTVQPGTGVRLADVLSPFGRSGTGALLIESDGAAQVTSRTYTVATAGSYGQFIPAMDTSAGITPGETSRMIQVSESGTDDSGFRTNLGLVNLGATPVTAGVKLLSGGGTELGTVDISLQPMEHHQENRIFRAVTGEAISFGSAEVTILSGPGPVVAYASVVDNRSGDPVFIPARKED